MWPSGLRRCVKAAVRKGVGSNPTAVTFCKRFTESHVDSVWVHAPCEHLEMCNDSVAEWSKALR